MSAGWPERATRCTAMTRPAPATRDDASVTLSWRRSGITVAPVASSTRTMVPVGTSAPAAGYAARTVSKGLGECRRVISPSASPLSCSTFRASPREPPRSCGTRVRIGPVDTITVTAAPGDAAAPAGGSVPTTSPAGKAASRRDCTTTGMPRARSTAPACSTDCPATTGISWPSVLPAGRAPSGPFARLAPSAHPEAPLAATSRTSAPVDSRRRPACRGCGLGPDRAAMARAAATTGSSRVRVRGAPGGQGVGSEPTIVARGEVAASLAGATLRVVPRPVAARRRACANGSTVVGRSRGSLARPCSSSRSSSAGSSGANVSTDGGGCPSWACTCRSRARSGKGGLPTRSAKTRPLAAYTSEETVVG